MAEVLSITFDRKECCRLDKYLIDLQLHDLYSRTYIEKLISVNMITVNNSIPKKSQILKMGDIIKVSIPEVIPQDMLPQDITLDVVYEDDYLAVLNKPAGLVVHPGISNQSGTIANAVLYRFGNNYSNEATKNRPGIVHRLDRDTTGLMIIAKNDMMQAKLSDMFAKRMVKKTYIAITTGVPEPLEGSIENKINRSQNNPRKMVVTDTGRKSLTHYKVKHIYHYFALVEINLETGRMHQIRVHFADLHYPILGDMLYNTLKYTQSLVPENLKKKVSDLLKSHLQRQALHAWKLEFLHPIDKQPMSFVASLPEDMIYALDWLEKHFAVDKVSYKEKMMYE